jgi:hypothetical protein
MAPRWGSIEEGLGPGNISKYSPVKKNNGQEKLPAIIPKHLNLYSHHLIHVFLPLGFILKMMEIC